MVALELAAGECGSGTQPGLALGVGTSPCRIADNGRVPTLQSYIQMIDSDTRAIRRRRPMTGCQGIPQSRSDSDKAKQTQEMHCFAGRGLKCSDPILSEMGQSPWTRKRKSRRNRSGVALKTQLAVESHSTDSSEPDY